MKAFGPVRVLHREQQIAIVVIVLRQREREREREKETAVYIFIYWAMFLLVITAGTMDCWPTVSGCLLKPCARSMHNNNNRSTDCVPSE